MTVLMELLLFYFPVVFLICFLVIIERAGEMRVSTVTELLAAMADYTGGMIVKFQ